MRLLAGAALGAILTTAAIESRDALRTPPRATNGAAPDTVTEQVRKELLQARDVAWRSFFQADSTIVEGILAPELIAIQQHQEKWDDRAHLVALAKTMSRRGVRLVHLSFPRTEIQRFGDTAILYYTYIFETALGDRTAVDAGRGTEVFVRRGGRWVDVGWHLDNGAFVQRNGQWTRVGGPPNTPSQR